VLEAALVRCAENRNASRYDAECMNARQANSIVEARDDRVRSKQLEAESEAKRKALRETQEAAAEAQRLAEEEERRQREAEYLAQFGELPSPEETPAESDDPSAANAPAAVVSGLENDAAGDTGVPQPAADPLSAGEESDPASDSQ
jgi:hypothetical protein